MVKYLNPKNCSTKNAPISEISDNRNKKHTENSASSKPKPRLQECKTLVCQNWAERVYPWRTDGVSTLWPATPRPSSPQTHLSLPSHPHSHFHSPKPNPSNPFSPHTFSPLSNTPIGPNLVISPPTEKTTTFPKMKTKTMTMMTKITKKWERVARRTSWNRRETTRRRRKRQRLRLLGTKWWARSSPPIGFSSLTNRFTLSFRFFFFFISCRFSLDVYRVIDFFFIFYFLVDWIAPVQGEQ